MLRGHYFRERYGTADPDRLHGAEIRGKAAADLLRRVQDGGAAKAV